MIRYWVRQRARWPMSTYQPATAHSDSIIRPPCSKCGTLTQLTGIVPGSVGHELLTFECPKCRNDETRQGNVAVTP